MPFVFWCVKNTCPLHQSYHPAYHSPASFSHTHWHRHRQRNHWAIVADVWPALNQHWFNASYWLCLAFTGLGQCWASVNVRQWWDSDDSLYALSSPRFILRIVFLPKTYTRHSANVRPASQRVSGRGSRGFSRYPNPGYVPVPLSSL